MDGDAAASDQVEPLDTYAADVPPRQIIDEDDEREPMQSVKMDPLAKRLAEMYIVGATLLYPVLPDDAQIIMRDAPARAQELVNFSRHHPQLRRVLRNMTKQSDLTVLVIGHAATVSAILHVHNVNVMEPVRQLGTRLRDRQQRNLARRATAQAEKERLAELRQQSVPDVFKRFAVPVGPMMQPAPDETLSEPVPVPTPDNDAVKERVEDVFRHFTVPVPGEQTE